MVIEPMHYALFCMFAKANRMLPSAVILVDERPGLVAVFRRSKENPPLDWIGRLLWTVLEANYRPISAATLKNTLTNLSDFVGEIPVHKTPP